MDDKSDGGLGCALECQHPPRGKDGIRDIRNTATYLTVKCYLVAAGLRRGITLVARHCGVLGWKRCLRVSTVFVLQGGWRLVLIVEAWNRQWLIEEILAVRLLD